MSTTNSTITNLHIDPHNPDYFWCMYCGRQQLRGLYFCRYCARAITTRESHSGSIQGFGRSRSGPRQYLSSASFHHAKDSYQLPRAARQIGLTTLYGVVFVILLSCAGKLIIEGSAVNTELGLPPQTTGR